MEQVTLDSFANMDVCVVKEREAYSLVEEALRETLSKDNLSPDSVFFRAIPHKCHNPHYTTGAK